MQILQDTIIKIIIRQGSDTDRKSIVLTSGEQGYTTDSKRVFVGDGVTFGGNVVGNLVKPEFTGVNPPNNSVVGDLAFNSDTRKLYKSNVAGSVTLTDWLQVGGVYSSGDSYIKISADNTITLAPLSGSIIDPSLVQYPITLSGGKISLPPLSAGTVSSDLLRSPIVLSAGKISLLPLSAGTVSSDLLRSPIVLSGGKISLPPLSAGTVSEDLLSSPIILTPSQRITLAPLSANYISLDAVASPIFINGSGRVALNPLSAGSVASDLLNAPLFLSAGRITISLSALSAAIIPAVSVDGPIILSNGKVSLSARVPFERISTNTITASSGLLAYVDGVDKGTTPINPLSANIVLQSNQLLLRFQGATGTNTYSRGISGIRVGLGQYLFRFGPLPTANIYPFIQIHSLTSHRFTARTMSMTVSSLSVTIVEGDVVNPTTFGDVEMFLQINY